MLLWELAGLPFGNNRERDLPRDAGVTLERCPSLIHLSGEFFQLERQLLVQK